MVEALPRGPRRMMALCIDCGIDTIPRPRRRGTQQWYMVHRHVWQAAGMPKDRVLGYDETDGNFLCIPCLERRLGRELKPDDFTDLPVNHPSSSDTPLLAARKAGEAMSRGT